VIGPDECCQLTDLEERKLREFELAIDYDLRYHNFAAKPKYEKVVGGTSTDYSSTSVMPKIRQYLKLLYESEWKVTVDDNKGVVAFEAPGVDWGARVRKLLKIPDPEPDPVRAYSLEEEAEK
jgi:hypothetical protein